MLSPWLFLAICIALIVFVSGLFQGALGFGYAIAALTTLPLLVAPRQAHIIISLSGIPVMAMAAWTFRAGADWKAIRPALVGGLISLPIGLLTFSLVSADGLIRGTGLAILIVMLLELMPSPRQARHFRFLRSPLVAGLVSGYLAGAVSIGGPPIVAYALKQSWPPLRTKAFITGSLLLVSLCKGIGLFAGNFVTPTTLGLSLLAIPFAIGGVWLGARLGQWLSTVHYRRVVALILVTLSCWWLYRGSGKPASAPAMEHPKVATWSFPGEASMSLANAQVQHRAPAIGHDW